MSEMGVIRLESEVFPVAKVHTFGTIVNGGTPTSGEENWNGDIPFITPPDLNGLDGKEVTSVGRTITETGLESGSNLVKNGVIISGRAPVGYVGLVTTPSAFNQGCKVICTAQNHRYVAYALAASKSNLQVLANGTTFSEISSTSVANYAIPLPPLETQQRIADYLDRETAEIDAAVAELDKYVELLRVRKDVLSNAVVWRSTTGRKRLKFLIDEVDERAGTNRTEWPLLSVSIHDGVNERVEDKTRIQASSDNLQNYKVVQANNIVLNRMRAFQGALGRARSEGITSPDYAVLRAHDESAAEWIAHAMKTLDFIDQITMQIRGIGTVDQGNARTPRINVTQLFDLKIPFPDADHREALLSQLKREQEEMDLLIVESTKLRDLLLKRRSVLITEVVTGRKQV